VHCIDNPAEGSKSLLPCSEYFPVHLIKGRTDVVAAAQRAAVESWGKQE